MIHALHSALIFVNYCFIYWGINSFPPKNKVKSYLILFIFQKIHVSKQMNIIGWKMKVLFQFFSKPSLLFGSSEGLKIRKTRFHHNHKKFLCLIMTMWQFSEKPSSCIDRVNFQFSSNWVDIGVRLELKVENSMLEGQCLITLP